MEAIAPEELVRMCQRTLPEDTRAFELLVSLYKDRVYATAYRLIHYRTENLFDELGRDSSNE